MPISATISMVIRFIMPLQHQSTSMEGLYNLPNSWQEPALKIQLVDRRVDAFA